MKPQKKKKASGVNIPEGQRHTVRLMLRVPPDVVEDLVDVDRLAFDRPWALDVEVRQGALWHCCPAARGTRKRIMNPPLLCSKCHRSVGFAVETGLCFWHECVRLQAEVTRLRALLKRCESGSTQRFPECPICEMTWQEGPVQEHTDGCELVAALRTTSASPEKP